MLIGGIVLGLLLGLLSGGRLDNLGAIRLRWVGLLAAAVLVRFGTEALLNAGVDIVETLRLPLLATGFGLLLVGLWANRTYPGLGLAFVGILLNGIVIVVNGGHMPIWSVSLEVAGFTPADVTSALHIVLEGEPHEFFVNALILGDVFPIPFPFIQNVASLGDLFLTLGLAFFLFAGVIRVPSVLEAHEEAAIRERLVGLADSTRLRRTSSGAIVPETGLAPALTETAALQRPALLGARTGAVSPALAPLPEALAETADAGAADDARSPAAATLPPIAFPRPSAEVMARVRRHPYVRLALNGSFSALWAGQLISLFGDRIHQFALAAVVFVITDSVAASSLVFVAATLPNLLLSPIAGTLVDRWDQKEVLIVSDILRAAVALLVPVAAATNVVLVYPLIFLITTISIFFRPARVAILPRIVREDELLSANSALWVGETLADVIGYPLAGLFVVALGSALPVAFWLDAATYLASAALLSTIVLRSIDQRSKETDDAASDDLDLDLEAAPPGAEADAGATSPPPAPKGFVGELKAGWTFLRGEPVLLANTIQATIAQLAVGIIIALMAAYSREVFAADPLGWEAVWSFIETGQAVGSLVGGFVVGLIGIRFAKGRLIIGGYVVFGLATFLFGLSGSLVPVLGLSLAIGASNMVFLIPSQTLFQERTPQSMMGRVVGFRFALVFGAMTAAMGLGGLAAEVVGVTTVMAFAGLVAMAAGLAGLFVPAVRDA